MRTKKFFIIFIIVLMLSSLGATAFAADGDTSTDDTSTSSKLSEYADPSQFDDYTSSETKAQVVDNVINQAIYVVLTVLRTIALGIAIIMLLIIGIKYMAAPPEMKAELKKEVPTYFTGAIILFAATGILQILAVVVDDMF